MLVYKSSQLYSVVLSFFSSNNHILLFFLFCCSSVPTILSFFCFLICRGASEDRQGGIELGRDKMHICSSAVDAHMLPANAGLSYNKSKSCRQPKPQITCDVCIRLGILVFQPNLVFSGSKSCQTCW
jgi:hypothetical protein